MSTVNPESVLFLPVQGVGPPQDDNPVLAQIDAYLAERLTAIAEAFARSPGAGRAVDDTGVERIVDQIIDRLAASEFNHQSRGRVRPLLAAAREPIGRAVRNGEPIRFFFLYHGGYRARPEHGVSRLRFTPDLAELLLIHQVARLQLRLTEAHPPGVVFSIVINNGVAHYANDIPLALTEHYVDQLRGMIDRLGGSGVVKVLVQSELGPFSPPPMADSPDEAGPDSIVDPMVERFLGRPCSAGEARWRLARYLHAETAWGAQVAAIAEAAAGVICRQVAHPACLSFRPFPGGAIRVQNGAVGFRVAGSRVTPTLITPVTTRHSEVREAPLSDAVLARILQAPLDQDADWPSAYA